MALFHWEPVREINSLQGEMNRLFNNFLDAGQDADAGSGATQRRFIPPMDLSERAEAYLLQADLPGLTEADVRIELERNVLTISGQRRAPGERGQGAHRIERSFGSFSRSLTLPEGVDPKAIAATFEHGVLEVRIPKPEQRKPHRVSISFGGTQPPVESTAVASEQRETAGISA